MKLKWYYHRFKSMSHREVLWRVKILFWKFQSRFLRAFWQSRFHNMAQTSTRICDMMETISFLGLDPIEKNAIPSGMRGDIIREGEKHLSHRFDCFGKKIDLTNKLQWNRELIRGIDLPLEYAPMMDYRNTQQYGHFKYFWELGRFHHLVSLAKAYFTSGKDKYAEEVKKQIESFILQCPYLMGVQWTMPMETGLRLVSVCWIVAYLRDYLKTQPIFCKILEELIMSHGYFTRKNFSKFSSANNHLIGEVLGVFMAALCFRDLPYIKNYLNETWDVLIHELFLQFNADGGNREQAVHYHISCLNCFIIAGLLGQKNGLEFPEEYWQLIEKSIEYVMAMSDNNNILFQIGDSDDGKTVDLGDDKYNQVQSLLATGAVLFERSDFKSRAGYFDQMSFWLLGVEGKKKFEKLPFNNPVKHRIISFPETGYYTIEDIEPVSFKLVFDCGPLGFKSIAGHGHADSLSFVLLAHGKPFLIDPGTYLYELENPFRKYFRSTKAHNTVVVDGMNQSEMAGPFMWNYKANSTFEGLIEQDNVIAISGTHDGYMRLDDPVMHRRAIRILRDESKIVLIDTLLASAIHQIEIFFHFAPGCQFSETETNLFKINHLDRAIQVKIDPRLRVNLLHGQDNPIGGWTSQRYGEKMPIVTLCGSSEINQNQTFITEIYLR